MFFNLHTPFPLIQIQIQIIYFQSDVTYSKNIRSYHSDKGKYCKKH